MLKLFTKFLTCMMAVLLWTAGAQAQLAIKYNFAVSSGTYTSISGTGTNIPAMAADNNQQNLTMLPGFTVNGTTYTNARVSSNGWLILYGGTAPTTTTESSILSTSVTNGAVTFAPMNADLNSQTGTAFYYQTIGDENIFEWKDYKRFSGTGDQLNFQIRLNTVTGAITFVYGTCTPGTGTSYFNVGWKTNAATGNNWATDINNLMLNVTGSPNSCNWSDVVTGNANNSTVYLNSANSGVSPSSGLTYTWTPQSNPDPVRAFAAVSGITGSSATLSWTAPTGATQYNVRYRQVGSCAWTNFAGNPVSSATATLTGLSAGTYYQYQVQAKASGGDESIWSHIPDAAGSGSGYIATGSFQTTISCYPPTALTSTNITTTTADISWTAPGSPPSSGYQWEVRSSGVGGSGPTGLAASGSTGVGDTDDNVTGLTANTNYTLWVRSNCGGSGYSAWAGPASFTTACDATNIPYTQDFESVTPPAIPACTKVVQGGSGNLWATASSPGYGFTTKVLQYGYNFSNAANTWFFTQGLNLVGGTTYQLTYNYGNNSTSYTEKLYVAYGTGADIVSMTNSLADHPTINQASIQSNTVLFTPAASGIYYIGFQAYSAANQFNLYVDNISVIVAPTDEVDWCNLQHPPTGTITAGQNLTVYTQGYEPGVTPGAGAGSGISAWIGYSSSNTDPSGGGWTWVSATFNVEVGNNDEFKADIGSNLAPGTYYYASRWQLNGGAFKYGGYSSGGGGFWNGTTYVSGVLTVNPIPNDECAGSINLTPTAGIFTDPGTQNWSGATMTGSPANTCGYTYQKDLWYVFTTDNDGNQGEKIKLSVTPSAGQDIAIELYTGSCGGLMSVVCKDTAYTDGTEIINMHEPITPFNGEVEIRENTTYYLRVMLWTTGSGGSFTISSGGSTALPVNLLSFSARAINGKEVSLNWSVAAEENMDGYLVERSKDGRNFEAIGKVDAAQRKAYAMIDKNPIQGVNYYRLKMVDRDGAFKYSEVRQVVFSNGRLLSLYPNPTSGHVYVSGLEGVKDAAYVNIYNEMGMSIYSGKIGGDQLASGGIDMSKYAPGAYMIRVISDEVNTTMRFVKE